MSAGLCLDPIFLSTFCQIANKLKSIYTTHVMFMFIATGMLTLFRPEPDCSETSTIILYFFPQGKPRLHECKSFIHLVVCLTTGPKPLPNPALHTVRSRASSFNCEYPLLSLRPSSSFLRFLPRLPVTSIPPFIFPLITRCRRQFLRRM